MQSLYQWTPILASGLLISLVLSNGIVLDVFAEQSSGNPPSKTATPLKGGLSQEAFDLTDDVKIAEAQVTAFPDDPEAHFLLAIAYSRTPYFEKAFYAAKKAKKLIKHSPGGYANFDQKINNYQAMAAINPNDTKVLYRLAFGYFMKGYLIEKNYIKNSPQPPEQFYSLAETTLRQVIALDPKDLWARNYLGFVLVDMDETRHLDEAISLWEGALALQPDNPGANLMLGEAYLKKGNLRKAVQYGAKGLENRFLEPGAP